MKKFPRLNFNNSIFASLPLDLNPENIVRPNIENAIFSKVIPTPVEAPHIVSTSMSALNIVGITEDDTKTEEFIELLAGNRLFEGCFMICQRFLMSFNKNMEFHIIFVDGEYLAHCYCGYQFGHFSGQLGDGAAMMVGRLLMPEDEQENHNFSNIELQFKGSGLTPYSRSADGRKVLRSSLREYLCSETMFYLNIPTTRSGSLITSDTMIVRDPLYNGNPIQERASVITRMAQTFLRFGSFEICLGQDSLTGRSGPNPYNYEILRRLTLFTLKYQFPYIWNKYSSKEETTSNNNRDDNDKKEVTETKTSSGGEIQEEDYVTFVNNHISKSNEKKMIYEMFLSTILKSAKLVALWQCVGFCHGVLNTDNMSIVGLTIDYGPYGFLDMFDPTYICNGSDSNGRYSYQNQPTIVKWNCGKLAEALSPLLLEEFDDDSDEDGEDGVIEVVDFLSEDDSSPSNSTSVWRNRLDHGMKKYDDWFQMFYKLQLSKKMGLLIDYSSHPSYVFDNTQNPNRMIDDTKFWEIEETINQDLIGHLNDESNFIELYQELFNIMEQTGADFTNTFRSLLNFPYPDLRDENNNNNSLTEEEEKNDISSPKSCSPSQFSSTIKSQFVTHFVQTTCVSLNFQLKQLKPKGSRQQVEKMLRMLEEQPMIGQMMGVSKEFLSSQLDIHNKVREMQEKYESNDQKKIEENESIWGDWFQKYWDYLIMVEEIRLKKTSSNEQVVPFEEFTNQRFLCMKNSNPRVVLRNYMAQMAIEAAEEGDYGEVNRLLQVLSKPFDEGEEGDDHKNMESQHDDKLPPDWCSDLCVTCSS